jgi:hypothetical protein
MDMDYKALRFMGFYIHENDAFARAQEAIKQEMQERGLEKGRGNLYQPDPKFKDAVTKFSEDYKKFGEGLLKRANEGHALEHIEIQTLNRAERLYATALGSTLERAPLRLSFLDAGIAMHGKGTGPSLTRQVEIAAGIAETPHAKSGVQVELTHRAF